MCTGITNLSTDRCDILSPLSSCSLVPAYTPVPSVHTLVSALRLRTSLLPPAILPLPVTSVTCFLILSLTENSALQHLRRFFPLYVSILSGKNLCSQSSCCDRSHWTGKHGAPALLSSPTLFTSMPGNLLLSESHFPWPFPSQDRCHHMVRGDIHLHISLVSSRGITCQLDTKLSPGMIQRHFQFCH